MSKENTPMTDSPGVFKYLSGFSGLWVVKPVNNFRLLSNGNFYANGDGSIRARNFKTSVVIVNCWRKVLYQGVILAVGSLMTY